jgi:hypothetical protein
VDPDQVALGLGRQRIVVARLSVGEQDCDPQTRPWLIGVVLQDRDRGLDRR